MARSSGGGKRLESSPQRGEEAIVNERLASVTSAGEGDLDVMISRDIDAESVTGKINSHALLSEGEKEVVNELERILQPQERGWQNNNYSMSIFEVEINVVTEGYVRSTPLSRIRNTRYSLVNDCALSLGEVSSTIFENSCNTRHSEAHSQSAEWLQKTRRSARLFCNFEDTFNANEKIYSRKNPAYYCNTIKLKGIHMNNSTETAHASMPLSIFASKNLAAWLPSRLAAKRVAFTLAEVLITLGIIGVVATLTLPSVVANYKEKQLTTAWKKAYSDVANAALLMSQNNEDLSTEQKVGKAFAKYLKVDKVCNANKGVEQGCWRENTKIYNKDGSYAYSDPTDMGGGSVCMILTSGTLFCIDYGGKVSPLFFDINGYLKPNTRGKDVFYALFNRETYMVKPAKGYLQNWGVADCDWMPCTNGDGTCKGDFYGFGCSAEKLLK